MILKPRCVLVPRQLLTVVKCVVKVAVNIQGWLGPKCLELLMPVSCLTHELPMQEFVIHTPNNEASKVW